jgi:uncharacterized delta-60 repeat protein/uncharacterized repeat protein (TIGR01451 family)
MKQLFLFTAFLTLTWLAFAQPGSVDSTFNDTLSRFGDGSNITLDPVYVVAVQTDQKMLVGGAFTHYNSFFSPGLVRIEADGSMDQSFLPGINGTGDVYTLAIQPDGAILIGGVFDSIQGIPRNGIARLHADGSLDLSFDPGAALSGTSYIKSIVLQEDGKIIFARNAWIDQSAGSYKLIRIHPDGSIDDTFATGTGGNLHIFSLALQTDGAILIGGAFTTYNNLPANHLARVNSDGSLDTTFLTGQGTNSSVYTILVQADGKILLGGDFFNYDGVPCTQILRLEANGVLDPSLHTGSGFSPGAIVRHLLDLPNGQVLVSGAFTGYNGSSAFQVLRIDANGTLEPQAAGLVYRPDEVYAAALLANGQFLIGGYSSSFNWTPDCLTMLNSDLNTDTLFNPSVGASHIDKLLLQPDGKILISGGFYTYNGVSQPHFSRLNADGTIDTSFHVVPEFAAFQVNSMALQPDGKILIGRYYEASNSLTDYNLIRLLPNGQPDPDFYSFPLFDFIRALLVQPDGKILLAAGTRIYRFNPNGSQDASFNSYDAGIIIRNLCLQNDGKIYLTGNQPNPVRLLPDGTPDASYAPAGSPDGFILSAALQPDGKLLTGGEYGPAVSLRRLNTDGTVDTGFNSGLNAAEIRAILVQPDGKIVVGGAFVHFQYNPSDTIRSFSMVRFNPDGTVDNTIDFHTAPPTTLNAFALQPNGQLLAAGEKISYNNHYAHNGITRFNNNLAPFSFPDLYFTEVSNVSCAQPGKAVAHSLSGVPPFQYAWLDAAGMGDTMTFSGNGIYTCVVTDDAGSTDTASLLISGPSLINGTDLQVNLINTEFRPGFPADMWLDAFNSGCIPANGQLKLVTDTLLLFVSAVPEPSSQSGDTLIWDFADLSADAPHLMPHLVFITDTLAAIGHFIDLTTVITPLAGDTDTLNNVRAYTFPVVNGYDPNDKAVYPAGKCAEGYIEPSQVLTYTVRFQNTGNSEAIHIVVVDSLPASLDIHTVRVVGQSHPMWTEIAAGHVLKFHFDQIYLLDSTHNEPESHGYVIFEVKPEAIALAHDTEISNQADILFDFNPPVTTNAVSNHIYAGQTSLADYICLPVSAEIAESPGIERVSLYPNPASGIVTLDFGTVQQPVLLVVTDVQGKQVAQHTHAGGTHAKLDLSTLKAGIYFIFTGKQYLKVIKE